MLKASFTEDLIEAGCDEVGRGCLAGPVVAAAVVLPKDFSHPLLTDSKLLRLEDRIAIKEEIKEQALAYAIAEVDNQTIDEVNILNASFLAMHRAVEQLDTQPELLLIDGNRFNPYPFIPHQCIIKGDSEFYSIAAASVLAKTYRDELMQRLADDYPQYGWQTNVGYPTQKHRAAIAEYGATPWHRRSFRLS
ncbi:ribonuclease HII [Catalinimonas alkaloidigena]|uniref:ribonuclease HII n=1 Tax=Catalinimonas alkaloidigena TaxID=1075417 RepID=UPI0024053BFA|nr:ribonuclease HII [Catalinimonas alkaloidigena]MDF9800902.1 ribonuclease HII [Catalinimonas alkaloidigena]